MAGDAASAPRSWWAALGLAVALSALAGAAMWRLRQETLSAEARQLEVLSLALADEIDRSLLGAQQGMEAVRRELVHGQASNAVLAARDLRLRADLMTAIEALWLLDGQGRVIAASDGRPAPDLRSLRPRNSSEPAWAIGRAGPDADAPDPQAVLAVRIWPDRQQPARWLLGAMPAELLRGAFAAASPAADARMAVFRADGERLAGTLVEQRPFDEAAAVAGLIAAGRVGSGLLPDGSERLVSVRRLRTLDLVLVLTRDRQAVLGRWREAERLAGLALAALWVTLGAALWVVRRADQRRAQAQQALAAQRDRASRLESLGTLAGGVAHDFNNVLAGIVGYGEMAMDAAAPQSPQARHLDRLMQAAMRGKALVERILVFSRGGARAASVFALLPVVEEALSLMAATLPPGVAVERDFAAPAARLRGDPTQVFEMLTNLCNNAVQAMPDGGCLSVGLRRCRVGAPRLLSHAELAAGEYVELRVCDTGCGIPPGVMDRLFEPFFTTRGASSGTGLGLAVVYGFVAEMGGAIDVQSRPGRGAAFTLYMPEFREPASGPPPAGKPAR